MPTVSAPVISVAVPRPLTIWGAPRADGPSMNWTEPVGVAVLIAGPEVLVTVAVNVTDCPKIDGVTEEVTVVEVDAELTVWLRVPELPLKPPSVFVYTAIMVCGEPLTLRVELAPLVAIAAGPDPDTGTGAPDAAPSTKNCTEPVGVAVLIADPEVLTTVGVNVTDCPKID